MFKNTIQAVTLYLLISLAMTGCRVGNHSTQGATTPADPYSGYYLTEAKALNFIGTTAQSAITRAAPLTSVPAGIYNVMTNPVGLALLDATTGKAGFQANDSKKALPVTINKDFSLTYDGTSTSETFWEDPACTTYYELKEKGVILPATTPLSLAGNTLPLSGRVQITFQVTHFIQGECAQTLQTLNNCYQDATQCGQSTPELNTELHATVLDIFQPWIDSQALTPMDISTLVSYGYEVSYE